MSHTTTTPPSPRHFHDSLLKILGNATGYKAGVLVHSKFLVPKVLRDAGFDPDNLEAGGRPEDGWCWSGKTPAGFNTRVGLAYRNGYRERGGKATTVQDSPKGMWGLTESGVAEAKRLNGFKKTSGGSGGSEPKTDAKPLPNGSHFNDALLEALHDKSGGHPGIVLSQQDIIPLVLRKVGIDPDNLPYGWEMRHLWRQVRRSHDNRFHGRLDPPFLWAERGHWALSETGVEQVESLAKSNVVSLVEKRRQAKKRQRRQRKRKNATSQFLDKRLRETGGLDGDLWNQLRASITKRLPVSASADFVDDHIQNCWLKMIRLDALQTRIEAGKNITDTHLITYAMRTAFTDLRNMGTEPVCREIYGARTEREREKDIKLPLVKDSRLSWHKEGAITTWTDIADMEGTLEERVLFEELWMTVEDIIRTKKPKAGARYTQIVEALFRGFTVKDIASKQGVTPYRAAGIIAEARRCMREAAAEGKLSSYAV